MKYFFVTIFFLTFFTLTDSTSQAQWIETSGPLGGLVNCFAVSGTNLFAGSNYGVSVSSDNGIHWTAAAGNGLPRSGIVTLAVNNGKLFAATADSGTFRSIDNGTTWIALSAGLPPSLYCPVRAFAVMGSNLFAGTSSYSGLNTGVFLSTDDGTNWTEVSNGLKDTNIAAFAVSGTNLFAGTSLGGVFLSTNTGTSWSAVKTGLPPDSSVTALAVIGSNLFAAIAYDGVFLSTNNGTTWKRASSGLYNPISLAISGMNIFASGTDLGDPSIFISTNNGSTWTPVNTGLPQSNVTALVANGTYLFVAGPDTGKVWRRPLSEMPEVPPSSDTQVVHFDTSGSKSVALHDTTILRSHRINLINNSSINLVITGAVLTTSNNHFKISQILPGIPDTVKPGKTFSVIVDFFGDSLGTIFHDTVLVTISHAVSSYYIYLDGYSVPAPTGILTFHPANINFGTVDVSKTKNDTLSIINTGPGKLEINGYQLLPDNGAFSIIDSSAHEVNVGDTAHVILSFHPNAAGNYSGTLTLTSNDANAPIQAVPLMGTSTKNGIYQNDANNFSSPVYPNPASSILHYRIYFESPAESLEIFDPLGRKYYLEILSTSDGWRTYSVRSLPAGVYFVNDGKERIKFLKSE